MRRTSRLIAMAVGLLVLRGVALGKVMQTGSTTTVHANRCKALVVPAEDSGDEDSGDEGSDAGEAE